MYVIPVGPVIHEYFNCSINAITIFPILVRGIICLHSNRPAQPLARGQHVARSTLLFYPAKTFEMRHFFLPLLWRTRRRKTKKFCKLFSCLLMETCANTQQQQKQQLIKETEIESRISMAKPPLKKKKALFTSKLDLHFRKTLFFLSTRMLQSVRRHSAVVLTVTVDGL